MGAMDSASACGPSLAWSPKQLSGVPCEPVESWLVASIFSSQQAARTPSLHLSVQHGEADQALLQQETHQEESTGRMADEVVEKRYKVNTKLSFIYHVSTRY